MLQAGLTLDFPKVMKQVQAMFIYLLRPSLCLLSEKTHILEPPSPSFTILILPRPCRSQAFSFIRTFLWDSNVLNVFRSRTEKREGTKCNNCAMHTGNIHTCCGTKLRKGCSPLPSRASKLLPIILTEVSDFHPREVQDF